MVRALWLEMKGPPVVAPLLVRKVKPVLHSRPGFRS